MDDGEQKKGTPENTSGIEEESGGASSDDTPHGIVRSLRTYESDVAQTLRAKDGSVAKINLAEQKKREERQNSVETTEKTEYFARNTIISLVSILLIIVAGGTLAFLFYIKKGQSDAPIVVEQRSIISIDKSVEVDVTEKDRQGFISGLKGALKAEPQGSLIEIKVLHSTEGGRGQVPADVFFSTLGRSAPANLLRAVGNPWFFGFYNGAWAESVILVSVNSFDNAFDGMLRWEKNMGADLRETFLEHEIGAGTSTEMVSPSIRESFEDLSIRNRNTRILKSINGNVVLLYSFLDDKNLVITTSEQSFKEVLNRFLASRTVR